MTNSSAMISEGIHSQPVLWESVVNFRSSHSLFQKWTTLNLTQKTLANQVEKVGNQLQSQEFKVPRLQRLHRAIQLPYLV
ncbi:MAG: hypothetical protein NHB32_08565 [Fischerella sp. CENA71]|nr:hypothetical protein [Fischerella sp. CENA71]